MAVKKWIYDKRVKNYRSETSGKFIAKKTLVKMRDDYAVRAKETIADLAAKLAEQSITVQAWEKAMRAAVKDAIGAQYVFGRGGVNAMESGDWARAGNLTKDSYKYLRVFAEDIAAGKLSEKQIANRAQLYFASTTTAYERGRAAAWDVKLSQYPADGQTSCKANCKCSLTYKEKGDDILVTWELHAAESCDDCIAMSQKWSPLTVTKE